MERLLGIVTELEELPREGTEDFAKSLRLQGGEPGIYPQLHAPWTVGRSEFDVEALSSRALRDVDKDSNTGKQRTC